jgi:diguanylate cyclase (GGDEF)-like protein
MGKKESKSGKGTAKKLLDIESKDRLSSASIEAISDKPKLLKQYLESSITNNFSELMFRLTHEIYAEDKARGLWDKIASHRENLRKKLKRDVGMLVSSLDYLSNISGDLSNPKIIDDLRIEEAAVMATRDSLTGLYMKNVFEFSIERLFKEHLRYEKDLSLLLLDIDNFKEVNDSFGHQAGDEVLRRIGKIIMDTVREADLPARYGGEELTIILPETSGKQALAIAERLRKNVNQLFKHDPVVTVSIGVSSIRQPGIDGATDLVRLADKALYVAKAGGKNKVRICK